MDNVALFFSLVNWQNDFFFANTKQFLKADYLKREKLACAPLTRTAQSKDDYKILSSLKSYYISSAEYKIF